MFFTKSEVEMENLILSKIDQLPNDAKRVFKARCVLRVFPSIGQQDFVTSFRKWEYGNKHPVYALEAGIFAIVINHSKAFQLSDVIRKNIGERGRNSLIGFQFSKLVTSAISDEANIVSNLASNIAKQVDEDTAHTINEEQHRDIVMLLEAEDPQAIFSVPLWNGKVPESWLRLNHDFLGVLDGDGLEDVYLRYQGYFKGEPDYRATKNVCEEWQSFTADEELGRSQAEPEFTNISDGANELELITTLKKKFLLKIGKMLQEERVSRNLPIDTVAKKLKFDGRFLSDLESGDWSNMPGEVYGIGFLRQYSDLLNIDVSEFIEKLKGNDFGTDPSGEEVKDSSPSIKEGKDREPSFIPYEGGQATASLDNATSIDHLGREALVNALRGLLDHPEQSGELTIGLMGHWGAGKSSVIKMLEEALCDPAQNQHSFICAEFDAWVYEHCGNIQAGMAQEVVNGLTKGLNKRGKFKLAWNLAWKQHPWKMHSALWGLVGIILSTVALLYFKEGWFAGLVGASSAGFVILLWKQLKHVVAHPLAAQLKSYLRLPDFGEHIGLLPVMREQVSELCKARLSESKEKNRLLFVIDNLDRCGVEGLVKVLEATHIVMGLPQVVVIIAVDHRMALAALSQHYSELAEKGSNRTAQSIARDYLGKIFQLSIQLDGQSSNVTKYINENLFPNIEEYEKVSVETSKPKGKNDNALAEDLVSVKKPEKEPDKENQPTNEENGHGDKKGIDDAEPTIVGSSTVTPPVKVPEMEVEAMKDTFVEKERFKSLASELNIHNPRQLKRLHNTYRLMKGIAWHRRGHSSIDEGLLGSWLKSMSMLFWLEHLYGLDSVKRKKDEDDFMNLKLQRYKTLRMMFSEEKGNDFKLEYERLKVEVEPLMLPFTDKDMNVKESTGS